MTSPWTTFAQAMGEAALAFARRLSPTSTPSSPPASTTQETSTAPDPMTMMTMMREMLREEREETRKLVMGLVYPTMGNQTNGNGSTPPFDTPPPDPWAEVDAMPLGPEIEAALTREAEEAQLQTSLQERARLQGRLRELQEQERRLLEETSDAGPWLDAGREPQ